MNDYSINDNQRDTRYFVNLALKNFQKKARVDFELYRPEMKEDVVVREIEAAGFNSNHHEFPQLIDQVKHTFTLGEISQFIHCLASLNVIEMSIETAVYRANGPMIRKKGVKFATIYYNSESFDFSQMEDYDLPFVIEGYYDPNQTC